MIELGNDYVLTADKRQFMLKKRLITQSGNNKGEAYLVDVGFYPTVAHIMSALTEIHLYDAVAKFDAIDDIKIDLEEWAVNLKASIETQVAKS